MLINQVSEELVLDQSTESATNGVTLLQPIWTKLKESLKELDHTSKTFFKVVHQNTTSKIKELSTVINNVKNTTNPLINEYYLDLTLTLPNVKRTIDLITVINNVYMNLYKINNGTLKSTAFAVYKSSLQYFNITYRDGIILPKPASSYKLILDNITLGKSDWCGKDINRLAMLSGITADLLTLLQNSTVLDREEARIEKECFELSNLFNKLCNTGLSSDAKLGQDKLHELQLRIKFIIDINKIYQFYVTQLNNIFVAAWTNIVNFNMEITKRNN